MARGPALERPVYCSGSPSSSCDSLADVIAIQLRADEVDRPQVVILGLCREHRRESVRALEISGPSHPVDVYSIDMAEVVIVRLLDEMSEEFSVLTVSGVA